MELEIKHLAPYLHHELKFIDEHEKTQILTELGTDNETIWINGNYDARESKFILHPISDLIKEIKDEFDGIYTIEKERGKLVLNEWRENKKNLWMKYNGGFETYPYEVVQWLFSKHGDVFGLIGQKKAIDINTLDQ